MRRISKFKRTQHICLILYLLQVIFDRMTTHTHHQVYTECTSISAICVHSEPLHTQYHIDDNDIIMYTKAKTNEVKADKTRRI